MKALVHVTLKKGVLDPQGGAIRQASASLGYEAVRGVRQGKLFEIEIEGDSEEGVRGQLDELCQKLLANLVIEDYEIVRIEP